MDGKIGIIMQKSRKMYLQKSIEMLLYGYNVKKHSSLAQLVDAETVGVKRLTVSVYVAKRSSERQLLY